MSQNAKKVGSGKEQSQSDAIQEKQNHFTSQQKVIPFSTLFTSTVIL
jgi:hypothetical protein